MATTSPIAKVSVGRTGCGAAHASYITRMTALDPEGRDRTRAEAEERLDLCCEWDLSSNLTASRPFAFACLNAAI